METPTLRHSKSQYDLSSEGLCQTPLLLHQTNLHAVKVFKPPSIGTQSISGLEPYDLDQKILGTSSVYTMILCSNTAEGLATVKVHNDEAYTLGSKVII